MTPFLERCRPCAAFRKGVVFENERWHLLEKVSSCIGLYKTTVAPTQKCQRHYINKVI